MRVKKRVLFLCFVMGMATIPHVSLQAAEFVTTEEQLRKALEAKGEKQIILENDLEIGSTLIVHGKKIQEGGQHYLRRKNADGMVFSGNMIRNEGEYFEITKVTISGSGKSKGMQPNMRGRLLEAKNGLVVLSEGARLVENYNMLVKNTGGGGVRICKGASVLAEKGSVITDNMSPLGGGIWLEKGSVLIRNGGMICDNVALTVDGDYGGEGANIGGKGKVVSGSNKIVKVRIREPKESPKPVKTAPKKKSITKSKSTTRRTAVATARPEVTQPPILIYRLEVPKEKKQVVNTSKKMPEIPWVETVTVESAEVETQEVVARKMVLSGVVVNYTRAQRRELREKEEMWSHQSAKERIKRWLHEICIVGGA